MILSFGKKYTQKHMFNPFMMLTYMLTKNTKDIYIYSYHKAINIQATGSQKCKWTYFPNKFYDFLNFV